MTSCRTRALGSLFFAIISTTTAIAQHKAPSAEKSDALNQKIWMQHCESSNSGLSESQCALWVSRKQFVHKAKCPNNQDESPACPSFQELIKDDDGDLMADFAKQDNVYACFRPGQDVFSEIDFSDPSTASVPGTAEVLYYKNGVASESISIHNSGTWVSGTASPNGPVFRGPDIRIVGSRFEASQTYKNESKLEIHHTIVLQLSTGRFIEKFEEQPAGETIDEYSGRCFVLPSSHH